MHEIKEGKRINKKTEKCKLKGFAHKSLQFYLASLFYNGLATLSISQDHIIQ